MEFSVGGTTLLGINALGATIHPAVPVAAAGVRGAVEDLFNLYLGRPTSSKSEVVQREQTSTTGQRRVTAVNRSRLPKDEQFALDFLQLQNQSPDHEQLRFAAEGALSSLLVQFSCHALQAEFLLFALQTLTRLGAVHWDSFIPQLLQAVATMESSGLHIPGTPTGPHSVGGGGMHMMLMGGSAVTPSTPASPVPSSMLKATPVHSGDVSLSDLTTLGSAIGLGNKVISGTKVLVWLCPLVCQILLAALEADLQPVTLNDILVQCVKWINQSVATLATRNEVQSFDKEECKIDSVAWLHGCVELIWALIDENRCRVPFYALLHDRSQLCVELWPEDEILFSLFLEVHRRRDKIASHMLILDHHLPCPTFATLRMMAFTYPSNLGDPLHGEDITNAVQRGSLDWERSLRCLSHALRCNPAADWWRRVLLFAPRYRQQGQLQAPAPRPGPLSLTQPVTEFSSDMTCDAVVDRIMELMQPFQATGGHGSIHVSMTESGRWQEWLILVDLFYFFMRSGYIDFLEFIDKLAMRFAQGEHPIIRSNHVTWLLAQVFRLETVTAALSTDSRKLDTAQKILAFHMAERPVDQATNLPPQNMLLDFVGSSQILRLWSINRQMIEQLTGNRMPEHIQKGKQIDEWWKQVVKGERVLDYSNLDDKSMGMVWVLSHTVSQPICEGIMNWMNQKVIGEVLGPGAGERLAVIHEINPLPIVLLSGLSLHLCFRLITNIEEIMLAGQIVPSIGMVETYVRLLLVAPQTLFRHHAHGMMQKYQQGLAKPGVSLLILELLNYRLIPLYRYQGKIKQLLFDIAKILITVKVKRGEHRLFRLAENLGINLILSLREVILIKKELKGATTEFTETLNRAMVVNLAFTMKTRGIPEIEQILVLQPALEQILASSNHTWSEKTMRHFPPTLRDALAGRPDKRAQVISQWQQAEPTIMNYCRQLLSPTNDPSYVLNAMTHSCPQHRLYLCAGAWMLMDGHPENINTSNLGRIMKELSPEEVTANIYTMVDVLLHNIQLQLKHGHLLHAKDLLLRASSSLATLMWTQEILPFDITLLALADRDDDTHALRLVVGLLLDRPEFLNRVQHHCVGRGQQAHWVHPGLSERPEPQQALGQHLAGKDRFPIFFDEMCLRALPVIPLIIYRLVENDATETAERLLASYSGLLFHHPGHFSFVRDTLAYFYGSLPAKLIVRLLGSLDLSKIPFSEAFLQHVGSGNPGNSLLHDYYSNLLQNLVSKVIPPLSNFRPKMSSMTSDVQSLFRSSTNRGSTQQPSTAPNTTEIHKAFYQHQDPGTYSQLVLETAVVELLSLPPPPNQVVTMLVNVAVHIPSPTLHHVVGNTCLGTPRSPLLPNSPTSVGPDNSNPGNVSTGSGNANLTLSSCPLIIQACGLLLAQLPTAFHGAFYSEAVRIIKDTWWVTDEKKPAWDMDAAFAHAVWDPSWAVQDEMSSVLGNTLALLHAFGTNLPYDWLEGMHAIITLQRPISSVAHLRLAYRIIGPLLPRLVMSRPLFTKTLALLFTVLADVFSRNLTTCDPREVSDLVDFLHHAVMMEVQGSNNQDGRPRRETLVLCSKAVERLHPELQHLFRHLTADTKISIYAATHPKLNQRPTSSFGVI